jgi:hypothetical protein
MMHLTGKTAAFVFRRVQADPPVIDRHERKHLVARLAMRVPPHHADSLFCSPAANLLEMRRGASHYPVIGRFTTVLLAPGYVGGHSLNDEVQASNSEVNDPGAHARDCDD